MGDVLKKFKIKKQKQPMSVEAVIKWIIFIVFFAYAVTLVFPFFWMLMNSFKSSEEFFRYNVWGFPRDFIFTNYRNVFTGIPTTGGEGQVVETSIIGDIFGVPIRFNIIMMFFVSVIMTLSQTTVSIFVTVCTAYVVSKYKFPGRNFIFNFGVFLMVVPIVGTLPAQFRLMQSLGLVGNPLSLILLSAGPFGISFFLMYGFFKSISWSYAEAAFMDGAGHARVFFTIMFPLAFPAILALSIISFIGGWNDYIGPALYMRNIPTLAVGLRDITVNLSQRSAFPEMFAAMMIALIPVLTLFILFQKTIMRNTVAGGLKG